MVTRKKEREDDPATGDDAAAEKKERVIHTRVPESLEAELRERAQDLGISVSNLVRNVLGHAFGLVGDVAADAHAIARAARGEREAAAGGKQPPTKVPAPLGVETVAPTAAPIEDVLGWQAIVLGKNAICARCNDILPRGRDAALGFAEHTSSRVIVCTTCLDEVRK